jgi:Zn-dependent protease
MSGGWQLGTFRGIPIGLHWSMLLVFALLVTSLATSLFPVTHPDMPDGAYWVIAVVCAVLFFGSILLHELGHSLVAQRQGIKVKGIMLFVFGGVAQMGSRSPSATIELKIAVAGPVVSLALSFLFWVISLIAADVDAIAAPAAWLAGLNLIMALFNLLPGFPLDGGRILRALVWRFSGSEDRAARVAQTSGQVLALGMMGVGVILAVLGYVGNGLWLIILGWFLRNAATTESASTRMELALRGVTVGQALGSEQTIVPSWMKLRQLVENYVLDRGESSFLVIDEGVPRGIVTVRELGGIPQSRLEWTSVGDVMRPWNRLAKVTPQTPLLQAIDLMDTRRTNHLAVAQADQPLGVLTREDVGRYIRIRMSQRPR